MSLEHLWLRADRRLRYTTDIGQKGDQRLVGRTIDRRGLELDLGLAVVQADALRLLGAGLAVDDDPAHVLAVNRLGSGTETPHRHINELSIPSVNVHHSTA